MKGAVLALLALVWLAGCGQEAPPGPETGPVAVVGLAECEPNRACRIRLDGISIDLYMEQPVALRPFRLSLRSDVPLEGVTLRFEMADMDMGQNRYRMLYQGNAWVAEVRLPVCHSGRSDWLARFELVRQGQTSRFTLPFRLLPTSLN